LYDPRIGRFIQADPIVDDGSDPQAFNRYAYVGNNPMSVTDPTGYRRSWGRFIPLIVAAAFAVPFSLHAHALAAEGFLSAGFSYAAAGGAIAGGISGGSAKSATWGAISAVAFFGIGQALPGADRNASFLEALQSGDHWTKVAAHAATGGVLNHLQGGDFGSSFISAGITEALSPAIGNIENDVLQLVTASAIGGSVSELSGGNFANGAATSAFQMIFNEALDYIKAPDGTMTTRSPMQRPGADPARTADGWIMIAYLAPGAGMAQCAASGCGGVAWAWNALTEVPVFKMLKIADRVGDAYRSIAFARSQLQHAFKHAKDFGVLGNANTRTLAEFSNAIQNHIAAPGTRIIEGFYRGTRVTHFVDPATGLNVIRDASGSFLSGWKLSSEQLDHVLSSGKLGGG
jgi:hypothetical protein